MSQTTLHKQSLKTLKLSKNQLFFSGSAVIFTTLLGLFTINFLHPFSFSENANAETASLDTSVTLEPAITIWTTDTSNNASSQVNIAADPDESVATGTIRAHVSTNNLTGYTLTMQSNSTDAKMVHENESITKTINPLTGSGTSSSSWKSNSNLNNMWGYSIGNNDSFLGVPGSSSNATTIDETDAPNNDNYTDVTFAAKADLSLPAGTYTDTVIFSAVANAVPTPFVDNTYMQDYAGTNACADSESWDETGKEYTLKDKRDENKYKIRKLADNHCWMVTNLKLGKTTEMTLYNTDTDITDTSWNLPASSTITGDYDNAQMHIGTTSDSNWTSIYGNYYNWPAATAGKGTQSTTSGNIDVSICPKGWKLPKGEANTVDYSWAKLYLAYSSNAANFRTATNTGTGYWSGYYSNGSLYDAGSYGYWWSRTAYNAFNAYRLRTHSSGVAPQSGDLKDSGFSVCCVLSSE